ncbi:hypothetical protein EXIGLDRAFT_782992 [Exidia glandulosa HHB12029]|uniref:Uncharacterized protein n=1 Tax=Exidia glandulosa HHB12029 TaxID=1314781 RepID=A0A166NBH4_EXIGL|nr:hypothetical protein EXIGLDRAFT_782992 [Exidia glandulosa HHB12029]
MSQPRGRLPGDVLSLIALAVPRTSRSVVDPALLSLRALNREARIYVGPLLRLRLTLPAGHLARRALAEAASGRPWKHIVTLDLGAHAERLAETLSIAGSDFLPNLKHMCIYARVEWNAAGHPNVDPLAAIESLASMSRLTTLGLEFADFDALDASLLINALVLLPGLHLSLSTGHAAYILPASGLRTVCLGTLRLDPDTFNSLDRCDALHTLTDVTGIALVESDPDRRPKSGWGSPAHQALEPERVLAWLRAPSVVIPYAEKLVYFCVIWVNVSPPMAAAVGELVALETLLWHPCTDTDSIYMAQWEVYERNIQSRPAPSKFIDDGYAGSWLGKEGHAQFDFLIDNVMPKLPKLAVLHIGLCPCETNGYSDLDKVEDMWARASAHGEVMKCFKKLQIGLIAGPSYHPGAMWQSPAEVEQRVMPFTYTDRVTASQSAYIVHGLHARDVEGRDAFNPFGLCTGSRLSEW